MMNICQQILSKPELLSNLIASLALIVSCVSTILALRAVSLQREHNRISVKPLPDIILADYESEIAVKVHNHGLGPMIIEKLEILKGENTVADNLIDLMPSPPNDIIWDDFIKILAGRILAPGDEKVLIKLSGDSEDQKFVKYRDKARQALAPLVVKFYYKGVYDKKVLSHERSLVWFGR
jgi:hypothetical protein